MLSDKDAQKKYIKENYPEVTDQRLDDAHWDILCTECQIVRGFQVIKRGLVTDRGKYYSHTHAVVDLSAPETIFFHCPVCHAYKLWIIFTVVYDEIDESGDPEEVTKLFRVTSIPSEGLEEIDELPEEPSSLRTAYRQAVRAMDANAHIAAASMFRRALQIITRDILKVAPGNLANELKATVGMSYNGSTLTKDFSEIGYIVKEAGNQGAHPDGDPDLLDFTQQDAEDLQKIFMELVGELFIVPVAVQKTKEDFLKRRKIKT